MKDELWMQGVYAYPWKVQLFLLIIEERKLIVEYDKWVEKSLVKSLIVFLLQTGEILRLIIIMISL